MIPAFLVTLVATAAAAAPLRAVLLRRGMLDVPNLRSSHTTAVPRGGGIACLAGMLAGLAMLSLRGPAVPWAAGGAALALGVVGYADDRRNLSPVVRLGAQAVGGGGAGASAASAAGMGTGWTLALVAAGLLVMILSVNVVNFMDGINGMTALTLGVWGLAMAWLGSTHAAPAVTAAGLLASGSTLGFLPFNAPRARLFLGDVGSYAFGGLVGATSLLALTSGIPWYAVCAPAVPYLADVLATLAKRAAAGKPLLDAHREHLYQRLTDLPGLGHARVAAIFAAAAASASLLANATGSGTMVIVVAVAAVVAVAVPVRPTAR